MASSSIGFVSQPEEGLLEDVRVLLEGRGYTTARFSGRREAILRAVREFAPGFTIITRNLSGIRDPYNADGESIARELSNRGHRVILVALRSDESRDMFALLREEAVDGVIDATLPIWEIVQCIETMTCVGKCPNSVARFRWKCNPSGHFNRSDWEDLASLLDGSAAESGGEDTLPQAEELCDLFRSLVSACAHEVSLEKKQAGHGGGAVLRANVYSGDGPVFEDLAVKFGPRGRIWRESLHYDQYVGPLPDGVAAQLRWRSFTPNLGALAYAWVGDAIEDGSPLGPWSDEKVPPSWQRKQRVIHRLLTTSLDRWYRTHRMRPENLEEAVGLTDYYTGDDGLWYGGCPDLERAIQTDLGVLPFDVDEQEQWAFGDFGTFRSPIACLSVAPIASMAVTRWSPCHGDLHVRNVYALPDDSPRLIDFGDTSIGHVFRDFAKLEASLRLTCLSPDSVSLHEIVQLETLAFGSTAMGQHIDFRALKRTELQHALSLTMEIRRAALDAIAGRSTVEEIQAYYAAMLFQFLKYSCGIADEYSVDPEWSTERKELHTTRLNRVVWHALYGAALVAKRLREIS